MRNFFKTAFPFLILLGALALIIGTNEPPLHLPKAKQQCSGKCSNNNVGTGVDQMNVNPFRRLIVSL